MLGTCTAMQSYSYESYFLLIGKQCRQKCRLKLKAREDKYETLLKASTHHKTEKKNEKHFPLEPASLVDPFIHNITTVLIFDVSIPLA